MGTFDEQYTEGASTVGYRYWKAGDFAGAYAILIEVKDFKVDVPLQKPKLVEDRKTGEAKKVTHEDLALTHLTVFASEEHLDQGQGQEFQAKLGQVLLASDLKDFVGKVLVKRLAQLPSKAFVWRPVEGPVIQKVGAYYDNREAAAAKVLESGAVPDWA